MQTKWKTTTHLLRMSRGIKQRHFLPRKPGVIAYAGERDICIFTVMNIFCICFVFSNHVEQVVALC